MRRTDDETAYELELIDELYSDGSITRDEAHYLRAAM